MSPDQRDRYSRQVLFPPIGEEGQEKLLRARAVIVGCGALGSFQAGALARAGVGRIVIIDRDYVESSNLQRQWLFDEADAAEGLPKAIAAARQLARVNSTTAVEVHVADLVPQNAEDLLLPADVILDGTDNFETRYVMNDVAVKHGVAWIYGAAVGSYGLTMPILPGRSACLACLFPTPPSGPQPTCDTTGIVNAAVSLVASVQVADALKILAGKIEDVKPRLFTADVWKNTYRTVSAAERNPDCPACGRREFPYLAGRDRPPISLCGRNSVQIHERNRPIDLRALGSTLARLGAVRANDYAVRFFCAPFELTVFPDGRAIIKGTTDPAVARSLYAKYVGT